MHIRITLNKLGRIFNLSCLCVLMCFLFLSANAASASNGKVSQTHALFVLSKDSASYTHVVDLIITEWAKNNQNIQKAVQTTILKTGVSMFYTAMILFFGFFIFTASTFKGTQALGILVSVTLLMAMICNLILLPAFLLGLNKKDVSTILEEDL